MQTSPNSCKYGFHGDPFHQCLCTPHQIQTYRSVDIEGSDRIASEHISEAIQYRSLEVERCS